MTLNLFPWRLYVKHMVKEKEMLKELIADIGLEEILLEQGIEPVDALITLYQCGEFDLERLLNRDSDEETEDNNY